jgi:hypothetical protein
MNNILFDLDTGKITGLVDFDFSFIGHPFQEFLSSFGDLDGYASSDDPTSGGTIWERALAERGMLRPGTINGTEALKLVGKLEGLLSPFRLVHPVFLARQTADQIRERRKKAEEELVACLSALEA